MGGHFTIDEASFDALVARETGLPLQEEQFLPILKGLVKSGLVQCHIIDVDEISIYKIVLEGEELKKIRL